MASHPIERHFIVTAVRTSDLINPHCVLFNAFIHVCKELRTKGRRNVYVSCCVVRYYLKHKCSSSVKLPRIVFNENSFSCSHISPDDSNGRNRLNYLDVRTISDSIELK
jgi:hypothetical protein